MINLTVEWSYHDKELPIPCYKNKWQENKEETLPDGTHVLTIKIKEGEK